MNESLKTGRIAYLILHAICMVVLLFGLTPNKSNVYRAAINELEQLNRIDNNALRLYVHSSINQELQDLDFQKITEELSKRWRRADFSDKIDWTPASILPYQFDYVPKATTLAEIEKYFLNDNPIVVFKPDMDSWNTALRKATDAIVYKVRRTSSPFFTIEAITVQELRESAELKDSRLRSKSFDLNAGQGADLFMSVDILWSSQAGVNTEKQKIRGHFLALESHSFDKWLATQNDSQNIKQSIDGQSVWLPSSRLVWADIRDATITGGLAVLQRKNAISQKTMTVFGLSVQQSSMVVLAPFAIFIILIYLLAHLLHISAMASRNPVALSEYPWLLLYPGALSRSLVVLSFIFLPLISNIIILLRAWDSSAVSTWLGFILTLACLLVGVRVLKEARLLRKYARMNPVY